MRQAKAGVDGEIVHALLGLFGDGLQKQVDAEILDASARLLQALINRHRADGNGGITQIHSRVS